MNSKKLLKELKKFFKGKTCEVMNISDKNDLSGVYSHRLGMVSKVDRGRGRLVIEIDYYTNITPEPDINNGVNINLTKKQVKRIKEQTNKITTTKG